jgi:two-component system, chemotaxis family, protein-glutamate methylesterase/glutaminase
MPARRILALGASAGGLKALCRIVAGLPADLQAAVFVCQHVAPDKPSLLPGILGRYGALPARHPTDGERIENGQIYVALPDHQLMVEEDVVRVVRGPQESRFRPQVDVLFSSAARAHGPNVVGVVLSGNLDDGTAGLQAIKRGGGVAVVQDPEDAEHAAMPIHALHNVEVDYCVPIEEMAALLVRLLAVPAASWPAATVEPK